MWRWSFPLSGAQLMLLKVTLNQVRFTKVTWKPSFKRNTFLLRDVNSPYQNVQPVGKKTQTPHWPCHIKNSHIMTWHAVARIFCPTPWLLAACLTTTHCIRPVTGRNKSLEKDRSFKGGWNKTRLNTSRSYNLLILISHSKKKWCHFFISLM